MKILKYIYEYFKIKKSGIFDEKFYLLEYKDVRKADINPLWHYIKFGKKEGRKPNANFRDNKKHNFLNGKDYVFERESFPYIPLVSIIILTRNGLDYIKTLFDALEQNTLYPNFEVILVDNASSDDTIKFLKSKNFKFNLKIIKNIYNETFSKANNNAIKYAKGELLLFLNNDTEPIKGWLCELVKEYLNNPKLGSAGSKLIYPYKKGFRFSNKIQHAGIKFRYEGDFYRPYNIGNGYDISKFSKKAKLPALTAACLLVPKKIFEEVNGFDEQYVYGYEDVDLGLKILKAGYENVYVPTSILFHYEFGTQSKNSNQEIKARRLNNIKIFKKKWHLFLKKNYWHNKLYNKQFFNENTLKIGIVVSNKGENIAEGDYFTAIELGSELEKLGYNIEYLSLKHKEWYSFDESIDVLIVLLDKYDLRKMPKFNKKIFTIAWARNWFDRWVNNPSFEMYDLVLVSGKTACKYIEEHSNQEAILFPIATNPDRFKNREIDKHFESDYCFTGNYWNDERDIIKYLNPSKINYKFAIFGKNWDKFDKFKKYYKGFISYFDIYKVYSNTKIVLDDANRVTKPYGSVNSRVFDALGAGKLVITNGKLGSEELFEGELPYYETEEELTQLLSYYLSNDDKRKNLVKKLQKKVLENHTYSKRARELKDLLEERFLKSTLSIKVPVPNKKIAHEWGDFHFAKSLKKELEKLDYKVRIDLLDSWYANKAVDDDVVLVLRGLSKYECKYHQYNIMWNISHPDKITMKEYKAYDKVYVASFLYANNLKKYISSVEVLLQCSDDEIFKPFETNKDIDILFVGNSRKVYRKIIKDLLPIKYNIEIYGNHWDLFIDKKYIKGKYIENSELYKFYSRAKIVLNDHWDDMREKGFISNRIFDVALCKGFVISDYVKGMEEIFDDIIVTYNGTREDLLDKIDYWIKNNKERDKISERLYHLVKEKHTFKQRAIFIDKDIKRNFYENSNIVINL